MAEFLSQDEIDVVIKECSDMSDAERKYQVRTGKINNDEAAEYWYNEYCTAKDDVVKLKKVVAAYETLIGFTRDGGLVTIPEGK